MRKFLVISGLSFGSWSVLGKIEMVADTSEGVMAEAIDQLTTKLQTAMSERSESPKVVAVSDDTFGFAFRPVDFMALKVDLQVVE